MVKKEKADSSNENGDSSKAHTSLFHHILSSETPESERSDEKLAKEAQVRLERLHIYPTTFPQNHIFALGSRKNSNQ